MVGALVEIGLADNLGVIGLDLIKSLGELVILLGCRGSTVILADRFDNDLAPHIGEIFKPLADGGIRLLGRGVETDPDGNLTAVDGNDTVRTVKDRSPNAKRSVIELNIAVRLLEDHLHTELAATAVVKIGGIGFERRNDLVGAGLIHIETPLGDVEVVGAPVAVVPGADIVVEAPEHRIEMVYAAGSELIGIGAHLRGAEPHLPIDVGIGLTFCRRILRIVPETHGMGRTAELLTAAAVVRVDILYIADKTAANERNRVAEFAPAALHRTCLENAAILFLGGDNLLGLVDRERKRLLAIDILAVLHRLDRDVRVPMVGRTDADDFDRGILKNFTKIVDNLALVVLVSLVDLLGTGLGTNLVAIANGDDLDIRSVRGVEERLQKNSTHLNSVADHSGLALLAGLKRTNARLRGIATCECSCGGCAENKVSSVELHDVSFSLGVKVQS